MLNLSTDGVPVLLMLLVYPSLLPLGLRWCTPSSLLHGSRLLLLMLLLLQLLLRNVPVPHMRLGRRRLRWVSTYLPVLPSMVVATMMPAVTIRTSGLVLVDRTSCNIMMMGIQLLLVPMKLLLRVR